jgi:transposase
MLDGVGFAGRMEVIEQSCGRRTWPVETKLRVVAESHVPGASVGEVAGRHGLQPGQVTTWRRLYRQGELVPRGSPPLPPVMNGPVRAALASSAPMAEPDDGIGEPPAFVPLLVAGEGAPSGSDDPPPSPAPPLEANTGSERIEIEVAGIMVRLPVDVPADRLAEVVRGLRDLVTGRPV